MPSEGEWVPIGTNKGEEVMAVRAPAVINGRVIEGAMEVRYKTLDERCAEIEAAAKAKRGCPICGREFQTVGGRARHLRDYHRVLR